VKCSDLLVFSQDISAKSQEEEFDSMKELMLYYASFTSIRGRKMVKKVRVLGKNLLHALYD
jgi:hypothetical protein